MVGGMAEEGVEVKLRIYLSGNPTITSQEKGINRYTGAVYTKREVLDLKEEYARLIRLQLMNNKLKVPEFSGAVRLKVIFGFSSVERKLWGRLKTTKPDNDNAVKALQDTLSDMHFFSKGDQQVADLQVIKLWSDRPFVDIEVEEVAYDIYRV